MPPFWSYVGLIDSRRCRGSAAATPRPRSTSSRPVVRVLLSASAAAAEAARVCTPSATVSVSGAPPTVPTPRVVTLGGAGRPSSGVAPVAQPASRTVPASTAQASRAVRTGRVRMRPLRCRGAHRTGREARPVARAGRSPSPCSGDLDQLPVAASERLRAAGPDHHRVLDAHPAAPGQVDPGLDGDDHAGGDGAAARRAQERRLVDLQADAVTQPVHELVRLPGGGDDVTRGRVDL